MRGFLKKLLPPPGPVLSMALIGLMLLGGFLYYKAIRFQRFLEPTLALTQPGSRFDEDVRDIIRKHFEPKDVFDVRYALGSLYVSESALGGAKGPETYEKLGNVFMDVLGRQERRSDIKVILVSTTATVSSDPVLKQYNSTARREAQDRAEEILNTLYAAEPELEAKYGTYFEPTAKPVPPEGEAGWVAFRIIPSVRLHIEVLQKLEKYIE